MTADPHRIALKQAIAMVERAGRAKLLPVRCWSIDAKSIRRILEQKDTARLRIYLAQDDQNQPTLVFLGADAAGQEQYRGEIAEYSLPCPPNCPDKSPFQEPA